MKRIATAAAVGAISLAAYAGALALSSAGGPDEMAGDMPMKGMMMGDMEHAAPKGDDGPSSLAFQGVNNKMHTGMDITFTGDADIDFVRGMIPHHQGAIDMAKVVIAFGDDPEVRKLAEGIIAAQEGEIAQMQAWLKSHGG